MIWYEKLKTFDFNHVKNIAKKYGKNKIIAEKLKPKHLFFARMHHAVAR